MKIAVIGAGAIGGLTAAYLKEKGEDVSVITRRQDLLGQTLKVFSVGGVRGNFSVKIPIKSYLDERVDVVIIATKTQDLEQVLQDNYSELAREPILTVQNGIRAEKIISRALPGAQLFASIVMFGATYINSGVIVHNFEGDWILGKVGSSREETARELKDVIAKIFPCPLSENIIGMKWLKLFLNANNCLPALIGKSMQETFANIDFCKISLDIWREGLGLVQQAGIGLVALPSFPADRIAQLVSLPKEKAAAIFSGIMTSLSKEPLFGSILQSLQRGRSSEIDYINGEFVTLAESIGVEAPLNRVLTDMVHEVESNKYFFSPEQVIERTKALVNR